MKELQNIIEELEQVVAKGISSALATVVKVKGSAYRRPGARMLMTYQQRLTGSISAGCLEQDVWEKSKKVMETGEPVLLKYDTTAEEDIVMGLGLGCRGEIYILVERMPIIEENYIKFIATSLRSKANGLVATIFDVQGALDVKVGDRLMLNQLGVRDQTTNSSLMDIILQDAQVTLDRGRSQVKNYVLADGSVEVFLEVLQPISIIIFGGGHDAIPMVRLAKEMGWYVTAVDHRPAYATIDFFPQANHVVLCQAEEIAHRLELNSQTLAVIMTHNYLQDLGILQQLLPSPIRYLGILGPTQRTQHLLNDIRQRGIIPTPEQVSRLYSPVGLDIGGENSLEIAIAIVAEILAVLNERSGSFLRDKKGPIH